MKGLQPPSLCRWWLNNWLINTVRYIYMCVRVCINFCYPFDYSYKLWYNYLRERRKQVKGKCVTEPSYEEVNNCHERALVFMHKVTLLLSKYPKIICASSLKNWHQILFFFFLDAQNMARLLPVSCVSKQDYKKPANIWPCASSSSCHSASAHLATIPSLCPQSASAWDSHPGVPQVPQGGNVFRRRRSYSPLLAIKIFYVEVLFTFTHSSPPPC